MLTLTTDLMESSSFEFASSFSVLFSVFVAFVEPLMSVIFFVLDCGARVFSETEGNLLVVFSASCC